MKTKLGIVLVIFLFFNSIKGQNFSRFSNVEELFNLTKNEVENKIVNENGYRLKSKDKSGILTYTKKNSVYTFAVNLLFKGDKLKMIGWDDTLMSGKYIVEDIGNDSCYKIDEKKTNDYLGIFTNVCKDKGFQVLISKTIPNLNKGMIGFTLTKINNSINNVVPKQNITTKSNLEFLKKYKGKYPYDVKLLSNPTLKKRIVDLMGMQKYNFMKTTWRVEGGIGVENNMFDASGCEQHNCDMTNFIIVVDLDKDILYIGYRVENEIQKFGEDQNYPKLILDWEKGNY